MPSPPVPAPRSLSVSSLTVKSPDNETKNFKDDIITFNIGGQIYSTTRSTINTNVDHQSYLALVTRNQSNTPLDHQGYYFIDRDGTYFRYILNYFREKKLILPENFAELKQLCSEAKFYQIDRLVNEIENRLNRNNEHQKQLEIGLNFTLISSLNQGGRILTLNRAIKTRSFLSNRFHWETIPSNYFQFRRSHTHLLPMYISHR